MHHVTRKHNPTYRAGDYKVISDESGLTVMNSECKTTWRGYKVHASEYDAKQPQLTINPRNESIAVKDARPESETDDGLTFAEGVRDEL
jgi:hypothetical protein